MLLPTVISIPMRNEISLLRGLLAGREWLQLEARMLQALANSPQEFLAMVRHGGLFRSSNALSDLSTFGQLVVRCCGELDTLLPNDPQAHSYTQSVRNLIAFTSSIQADLMRLRRKLIDDPAGSVMGMAGELGLAFYGFEDQEIRDRYGLSENFEPEDLADAFSLAVQMLLDAGKPVCEFVGLMDIHRAEKGEYRRLLEEFVALSDLRECEILVDRLGYLAQLDGDGWLIVEPGDSRIAKSLAHGFAAFRAAQFSWAEEMDATTKSLREVVRERLPNETSQFARFVSKPFPRIRVEIPQPLVGAIGSIGALFPEEMALLGAEAVGCLTRWDGLLEVEVTRGLTVGDLLHGQRTLRFVSVLLLEGLRQLKPPTRVAALRSMLPTFAVDDLVAIVEPALGVEKATSFCDALLDGGVDEARFDILYNPALGDPSGFALVLPVAHHANLIRNGLKRWRGRPSSLSGPELETRLAGVLRDFGALVATGVRLRDGGEEAEIDVLAQVEGHLFIFECKSGLFPGGFLELQPVLDQLEKGSSQCLKVLSMLSGIAVRRRVLQDCGWMNVPVSAPVVGTVVTNTRMLAGSRVWGVPIHSWLELENYIRGGSVRIGAADVRVRDEGALTAEQLDAFISGRRVHEHLFSYLHPFLHRQPLGRSGICQVRVAVSMESVDAIAEAIGSWRDAG